MYFRKRALHLRVFSYRAQKSRKPPYIARDAKLDVAEVSKKAPYI